MSKHACGNCQEILAGKTGKKHPDLQRSGLAKSVGHHGIRDDEYNYTCKVCGTKFIGDSCAKD